MQHIDLNPYASSGNQLKHPTNPTCIEWLNVVAGGEGPTPILNPLCNEWVNRINRNNVGRYQWFYSRYTGASRFVAF